MKLVVVDKIPDTEYVYRENHKVVNVLEEFVEMGVKFARVDYTEQEYVHTNSAQSCFATSIARTAYPIKAIVRNHNLYLVRTDI